MSSDEESTLQVGNSSFDFSDLGIYKYVNNVCVYILHRAYICRLCFISSFKNIEDVQLKSLNNLKLMRKLSYVYYSHAHKCDRGHRLDMSGYVRSFCGSLPS